MLKKLTWLDRLMKKLEMVTMLPGFLHQAVRDLFSGGQKDVTFGKERRDPNGRLQAVHERHHEVAKEQIRPPLPGGFHCRFALVDCDGFESCTAQEELQRVCEHFVVIGDEDFVCAWNFAVLAVSMQWERQRFLNPA